MSSRSRIVCSPHRKKKVPPEHHGTILENGDYIDEFGSMIDNIADWLP